MELALAKHKSQGTATRGMLQTNNQQPTNTNVREGFVPGLVTDPKSSADSLMIVGRYSKGICQDLHVIRAVSEDDSIFIGAHYGGSGNHCHESPNSTGRSIMILGDVDGDSTMEEIEGRLKRVGKPVNEERKVRVG